MMLDKLEDSALVMLRRHGISEEEVQVEREEPGHAPYALIRGHRVRIDIYPLSVSFSVRSGRWAGAREEFVSAGAFLAAFEEALDAALAS